LVIIRIQKKEQKFGEEKLTSEVKTKRSSFILFLIGSAFVIVLILIGVTVVAPELIPIKIVPYVDQYALLDEKMNTMSCDELKEYIIRGIEGDGKFYSSLGNKAEDLHEWKCEK
jgi:hypothetical protein